MNPLQLLTEQIDKHQLWDKELILERNQFLKQGGSVDTNLYYITEGSIRVFIVDENEELTIRFGYQGNIIAALDSFISQQPSDLFIQAIKGSKVKVISKKKYLEFINSTEENKELWNILMQQLILQQMERERDLLTSSPAERYKRVFARSSQLFQEIPHKYIASYLRMTPETLSRLKAKV